MQKRKTMSSSMETDQRPKVTQSSKKENDKGNRRGPHKKFKHDEGRHFKFHRKRSQSFAGNGGKYLPPHKRKKKGGGGDFVPPTKFLLGGNICDPLNLNSMQDEEVNRAMNAVTPKSSPLPTPKHKKGKVQVIIPPNMCDPLNLNSCNDDDEEYEKQLYSPTKKPSKRRNKKASKRKRTSSCSAALLDSNASLEESKDEEPLKEQQVAKEVEEKSATQVPEVRIGDASKERLELNDSETKMELDESVASQVVGEGPTSRSPTALLPPPPPPPPKVESPQKGKSRAKSLDDSLPKDKRLRKAVDSKDKIVSPVIPQPGARNHHHHRPVQKKKQLPPQLPKFNPKDAKFEYGNYNRYYGYRNPEGSSDLRLNVFSQRRELFASKDVLDIGCNVGHMTLAVGREFAVKSITGIDIDKMLINIARNNIKHYVNWEASPARNAGSEDAAGPSSRQPETDAGFFPISMPICYGPIDVPGFSKHNKDKGFPYNVSFVQVKYLFFGFFGRDGCKVSHGL